MGFYKNIFVVVFVFILAFSIVQSRWPPNFAKSSSSDPHHRPPPPSRHHHRYRDEPEEVFETQIRNNSNIKEQDNKTIDDFLKRERETLILFLNESVEVSNQVVPEFVNLTKYISKNFYKKALGYVNSSTETYLLDKFRITKYPTILFIIEEKEVDRWEGLFKSKDQMAMHFTYMQNYDTIIDVKTLREADAMLEEEYITYVFMITSEDSHSIVEALNILLEGENINPKNYPQIMVKGPLLKSKLEGPDYLNITDEDLQDYPDVIGVVKNYNNPSIKESHFIKFDVEISREELREEKKVSKKLKPYKDFIVKHAKQAIIELIKQDSYQDVLSIIDKNKPTVLFLFDFSFEKQFRKLEHFLDEIFFYVSNDDMIKGKFNYLYGSDAQFSDDLLKSFLLKKIKYPMFMLQEENFTLKQPNIYYLYDKKFDPVEIIKYLRTYKQKGKSIVVSEPLPKTPEYLNKSEPLRTITANTFQAEIINENNKDVFLMFYHHENEFCSNFMPLIEKLANKFPQIIFAKFNFAKNYLENPAMYELNETYSNLKFQLPKLYFFKKENKNEPIRYKERKKEDGLIEFLEKLHNRKNYQASEEERREVYELKLKYGVKVDPLPPIVTHVTIDLDELKDDL